MAESKKFIVTGATGFIGSRLTRALAGKHGAGSLLAMAHSQRGERDEKVFASFKSEGIPTLECDLLDLPRLGRAAPEFDVLYHLAAFAETETNSPDFRVNSDGTRNLLHWLGPRALGKRVVYSGTLGSVDRNYPGTPATEETPCRPRTVYGQSKLLGEEHIRSMAAQFGFDYTILRFCTVIGRGYRANGMFGQCPRLLAENRIAARLNWPGRVSFVSIRDAVRILEEIAKGPETANQLYVVSNGEDPTFDELLDQMARTLGLQRNRVVLPRWFWRVAARVAWPLVSFPLAPHRWKIFCWRASHIIHDGIRADAAKLNKILGNRYQSVLDALQETYGKF